MKQYQIINPERDVDYRDAEKTLKLYLKERSMSINDCQEWARWTYGDMPFWSVWGIVSTKEFFLSLCGIQIYDDGRVVIVSNSENFEELQRAME